MIDWSASMQQTYEFYEVDPVSWEDKTKLATVRSCSITRDAETDTLSSASLSVTDLVGEAYIRVYLVVIQNGVTEKFPLGTFIAQTPSSSFDGKTRNVSVDAYSPLILLKENQPPLGYYIKKKEDVMEWAYKLASDNAKVVVSKPAIPSTALTLDLTADPNDTWLTYIRDLITAAYTSTRYVVIAENGEYVRTNTIANIDLDKEYSEVAGVKTTSNDQVYKGTVVGGGEILYCTIPSTNKYKFDIDEMGRILFAPEQDAASLQPVWTYTDDNSSILYPELSMDHDLYGIPNAVEVLYSDGVAQYYSVIENNDLNSPISIPSRGRRITFRDTNPELYGSPTQERVDEYAEQLLRALSSVEYTLTYTHGYCPVRVGDCVRLDYSRAGLTNVKAKVISQSIKCEPGCPVTEKAVFTTKLWG